MLMIINDKEITNLLLLLCLSLSAGIVWEFFAPLIKSGAVTDIYDLVFYIFGTLIYWLIIKMVIRNGSGNVKNS